MNNPIQPHAPEAAKRIAELETALQAMWTVATSLIEAHGVNGFNTMTDRQHQAWQKASALANQALGPRVADEVSAPKSRVLVIVSGGIAEFRADDGIDVEVFDRDNYHDDPESTGGVPAHFADLAEPQKIPVKPPEDNEDGEQPRG